MELAITSMAGLIVGLVIGFVVGRRVRLFIIVKPTTERDGLGNMMG